MFKSPGVKFYDNLDRLNFYYPHYQSPFRVRINENFSQWMDRYCHQWTIDNIGSTDNDAEVATSLLYSIQNSDLGLYSACCFPSANWHRLEKLIKWCMMFFIVDDYQDSSKSNYDNNESDFWSDMLDMLNSFNYEDSQSFSAVKRSIMKKQQWPDFIKGIQMILREIYFDFTPEQIQRSVKMISDYIQGNLMEKQWKHLYKTDSNNNFVENSSTKLDLGHDLNTEAGDTILLPEWNAYLKARLGSVGGQMTLQLIEYAKNICLTDEEWNHPLMISLVEAVSKQMILVNDYLTFRKELAENNFKFSQMRHSFSILVNEGLNLQQAVEKVHELIQNQDRLIFKLIDQIMSNDDLNDGHNRKRLRTYLDGVEEVLGGYWRFAITARRYHGKNFHGAIPPSGYFRYRIDQTIIIANHDVDDHDDRTYNYNYEWFVPIPDNIQPQ